MDIDLEELSKENLRRKKEKSALFSNKVKEIQERYSEYLDRHEIKIAESLYEYQHNGKDGFKITVNMPKRINDGLREAFDLIYGAP